MSLLCVIRTYDFCLHVCRGIILRRLGTLASPTGYCLHPLINAHRPLIIAFPSSRSLI
ncbi:unnamed protein product [Brassica rapa subsp. narinosa]